MQIHPMWAAYPELQSELIQTIELIDSRIHLRNKSIEHALVDMMNTGGKLVRPAYTLLFSTFGEDQDPNRARAFAAAIEVLHMATLIHDDVIDDSPKRRGQQTIQSKYGKDIAVYAGDYLFTVSFKLITDYSNSMKQMQINTKGMEKILMGEIDQMHLRYNQKITIRNYLTQISGKTAQLFALSCYSGALESGQTERFARNCYYIGSHIGMAFQIKDDILDYTQTTDVFGKPVLEDVKQGIYSAPLIYAMRKQNATFKELLEKKEQLTNEETQKIQQLVINTGGLDEAKRLAGKYTDKALKLIGQLPDSSEKEIIRNLTLSLLERTI
ncbi:heptaprenyl diphosphate synthase component II [Carnobacterium sp. 17-4]|uniref:polyprenyl synthetase family protein n=1 Tax=Carnobacterium sp. (strain 17-4) TaxID=208596 RepID=UPI000205873E|nr:polyprenyl synthetase family protein [Carnobacterium sp. 17-4]AEB31126.1 heptaprenyl diphosphate synthase component II [Carnobacterium sp. 17-4]